MSRAPSRRGILGSGASLLLLSAAAANAEGMDGDLTRLAGEFMGLQARIDPLHQRWFGGELTDAEIEEIGSKATALVDAQDVLADKMLVMRATSPAGWRAKALVAREMFRRYHSEQMEQSCLDEDDAFALSLFGDMLGEAS